MPYSDPLKKIEADRKYRESNKERIAAEKSAYHKANRESILAKAKRYREANRDALLTSKAAYSGANREMLADKSRTYRKARRGAAAASNKRCRLFRQYGISESCVLAMQRRQKGKCEICGVDMIPGGTGLHSMCIDHCHATGRVRDLLCGNCNRAIGLLRDSPEIAMSAALYLERHAALAKEAATTTEAA